MTKDTIQTPLSKCCNAPMKVGHGCDSDNGHDGQPCNCTDGTMWNECTKCGQPCEEAPSLENQGEEPDTLCIEIKAGEITIGEQLEIGALVRMTVTGIVEEIRNSRYYDRIEEKEQSKRKYMIKGSVVNATNIEGHVISITEPQDDGEI